MDRKLPNIFANKIEKNLKNNKSYSVSKNEERKKSDTSLYDINSKINSIFSSYKYVYKADVIITLDNEEINKKIIGKKDNYLITIDNEKIDIDKIIDIRIK